MNSAKKAQPTKTSQWEQPVEPMDNAELKSNLQKDLADARAIIKSQSEVIDTLKSTNTPNGMVQALIKGWPGVDRSKKWCDVKWSKKDSGGILCPVEGELVCYTVTPGDPPRKKIHKFLFSGGRCCTNDIAGMRELLKAKNGFKISTHTPPQADNYIYE